MSDILIKGMEMPESCLECPFKLAGDSTTYCLAQTPTMKSLMPVKLHEIRWKKFSNAVEKFRWKEASCPLVPVPPHGDLIDRAELWVEINKICDRRDAGIITDLTCLQQILSAARHATTIIPPEEGET